MRRNNNYKHKSPLSKIAKLEEAIKRELDQTERENLQQHLEHWIRTQNNS